MRDNPGLEITVELPEQKLTTSTGVSVPFTIEAHAKHSLLNGLDDIGVTMEFKDRIEAFERNSRKTFPWLG